MIITSKGRVKQGKDIVGMECIGNSVTKIKLSYDSLLEDANNISNIAINSANTSKLSMIGVGVYHDLMVKALDNTNSCNHNSINDINRLYNNRFVPRGSRSNADRAKAYLIKQNLIGGKFSLDISILDDHNVRLNKVICNDRNAVINIPKFITEFKRTEIVYKEDSETPIEVNGVFSGVVCDSIILQSKMPDLSYLFSGIDEIKSAKIDFGGNNPVSISGLVSYSNIESITLVNLDSSRLVDLSFAFKLCEKLKEVHMGNIDLGCVKSIEGIVYGNKAQEVLDINTRSFRDIIDISEAFARCEWLELPDLSFLANTNIEYAEYAFLKCRITGKDLDNLSRFNCLGLKEVEGLFARSVFTGVVDIGNWNMPNVKSLEFMFYRSNLRFINIGKLNIPNVNSTSFMFSKCSFIDGLDMSGVVANKVANINQMFLDCWSIRGVKFWNTKTDILDARGLFINCYKLKEIGFNGLNLDTCNFVGSMFSSCRELEYLDLTRYVFSNIKDTTNMFIDCTSLVSVDFRDGSFPNLESAFNMFKDCESLTDLDISKIGGKSLTKLHATFSGCISLQNLTFLNDDTIENDNIPLRLELKYMLSHVYVDRLVVNANKLYLDKDNAQGILHNSHIKYLDISSIKIKDFAALKVLLDNATIGTCIISNELYNTIGKKKLESLYTGCKQFIGEVRGSGE